MYLIKSIMALCLLILLSQVTQAANSCIPRLMDDINVDSQNFTVHVDDIDRDFGNDYLAEAIYTVRVLIDSQGCSQADINFGQGPNGRSHSRCTKVIGHQEHTRVCYVETNLGYFFLTRDLLDNVNITYSRWD